MANRNKKFCKVKNGLHKDILSNGQKTTVCGGVQPPPIHLRVKIGGRRYTPLVLFGIHDFFVRDLTFDLHRSKNMAKHSLT